MYYPAQTILNAQPDSKSGEHATNKTSDFFDSQRCAMLPQQQEQIPVCSCQEHTNKGLGTADSPQSFVFGGLGLLSSQSPTPRLAELIE